MTTLANNLFGNIQGISRVFNDKQIADIQRLQSLPGAQASRPAALLAVYNMGDRVMVTCSDRKTRAIVTKTVNNTFNSNLSTQDIMKRLEKRLGQTAIFYSCSVQGRMYSPDVYFIGLVSI